MRLTRLHIIGFGALREVTLDFGPDLTVLLGENEAGKSTVLHCLSHVLFGKPKEHSAFPDFKPWDGGPFAAEVDFTQGGESYRLERRFDESGPRAQSLYRLNGDDTAQLLSRENSKIRDFLADAFGTADDRIFYRVFCLTQADIDPLDNYAGLREHLERAVSGADVAATTATANIDKRMAELRKGVSSPALKQNWGALKRAAEARKEWEGRLFEADRQRRRLGDVRAEMDAVQHKLVDGAARTEQLSGLLEQERKRKEIADRLRELRENWAALEDDRERRERLQQEHDRLQERVAQLPSMLSDSAAVRAQLAALSHPPGSAALGWGLITLGIVLAAIGLAVWRNPFNLLFLLLSILGIPMVQRVNRHAGAVAAFCRELGVAGLDDAARRLEEAERLRHEFDNAGAGLRAVSEGSTAPERRQGLALEIAKAEEALKAFPGEPLSAQDGHRSSTELDKLRLDLPGWQDDERRLTRELAVLEEAERDLTDLEDGVAYWKQEEARAKEEEQTLLLAKELLAAAGELAHGALADPLTERVEPLFAAMTGGRYLHVQVAADARAFNVAPLGTDGQPIEPTQLSAGTFDQFVLAVRLALGQAIAAGGEPVFFLDDPLLHFDADRRREAQTMLANLAQSTQIILATHDPRILDELPETTVIRMRSKTPEVRSQM